MSEKLKLSELLEVDEYKAVINVTLGGSDVTVYVKNPVGEEFTRLYEIIADILEKGECEVDGQLVNDENLVYFMIGELTNIEIDTLAPLEVDRNIGLVEVLSAIHEIHSDILTALYINLHTIYLEERKALYNEKFIQSYRAYITDKERLAKLEKEENFESNIEIDTKEE